MNFILSVTKFIKFKPIIRFKKFERHKYASHIAPRFIELTKLSPVSIY